MLGALILLGQLSGWQALWTRDPGAGTFHANSETIQVEHSGKNDWSLARDERISVTAGDIYRIEGDVQVKGGGTAGLCAVSREGENVVDWQTGLSPQSNGPVQHERVQFLVPSGVDNIQPRLIGDGPSTTTLANYSCKLIKHINPLDPDTPKRTLRNADIQVAVDPAHLTLTVTDLRAHKSWTQQESAAGLVPISVKAAGSEVTVDCLSGADLTPLTATFQIDPAKPEVEVKLDGDGTLSIDRLSSALRQFQG